MPFSTPTARRRRYDTRHLELGTASTIELPSAARSRSILLASLTLIGLIGGIGPANASGASPRENLNAAIAKIEAETGEIVEDRDWRKDRAPGSEHCLNENFCEGFIGELRIEAMGRRIDVSPSPRTPAETLIGSCIGVLSAFATDFGQEEVTRIVHRALVHALDGKVFTSEFETFEFEMSLNSEKLPICTLIRFVER